MTTITTKITATGRISVKINDKRSSQDKATSAICRTSMIGGEVTIITDRGDKFTGGFDYEKSCYVFTDRDSKIYTFAFADDAFYNIARGNEIDLARHIYKPADDTAEAAIAAIDEYVVTADAQQIAIVAEQNAAIANTTFTAEQAAKAKATMELMENLGNSGQIKGAELNKAFEIYQAAQAIVNAFEAQQAAEAAITAEAQDVANNTEINTADVKVNITGRGKVIESVRVNVDEAVNIINRLNYRNDTFKYRLTTREDDADIKYRQFDAYLPNGESDSFAIDEIVINGKLEIVRFFNLFRNIIVDLQIGDAKYTYGDKGEIILITEPTEDEPDGTYADDLACAITDKINAALPAAADPQTVEVDSAEYAVNPAAFDIAVFAEEQAAYYRDILADPVIDAQYQKACERVKIEFSKYGIPMFYYRKKGSDEWNYNERTARAFLTKCGLTEFVAIVKARVSA